MTTTTSRVDTWEMVLVHRVFRREFRMLPGLVRAVTPGDVPRAEAIGDHLQNLAGALHHHHTAEDELLWPVLADRIDAGLVRRMEAQHDRLDALLRRVGELNPRWRSTARAGDRDELAAVLADTSAALDEHLDDEENELLPLVSVHCTQAEWDALGARGQEAIPRNSLAFVFLGSILEEASPRETRMFLRGLPLPVRVAWRLGGRRVYGRARDRVRVG